MRHRVGPHVIVREQCVRGMPDTQGQLVDDEVGAVRRLKAPFALADPATRCRWNLLQVGGRNVVSACGPSVAHKWSRDETLTHGVVDAVVLRTHEYTVLPRAIPGRCAQPG